MNIRVILADDHPVVIFGVRQILGAIRGISIVAEATDPKMLVEQLGRVPCDVLVTDFSMPIDGGPDGLVMLKGICSMFPDVRVVVLTMLDNPGLVKSMLNVGAVAILSKRNELTLLPEIVTAAYQRRLSRLHQAASGCAADDAPSMSAVPISPCELEVVRLFANGMSMTAIARYLNRSIKTVSTQKVSAMRKLELASDAELFSYAQQHGLVA